MMYMGACCKPNCPADGSRGRKSDGCGKTCGCPSRAVLYGGSCCTPSCPHDGSEAGKSDGCGGTCSLPDGRDDVHGRLLHAELRRRTAAARGYRTAAARPAAGRAARCSTAAAAARRSCAEGRDLRRQRRVRRQVRLHRRRQVHERDVPDEDLHAVLRLRRDLQQRRVRAALLRQRDLRLQLLRRREQGGAGSPASAPRAPSESRLPCVHFSRRGARLHGQSSRSTPSGGPRRWMTRPAPRYLLGFRADADPRRRARPGTPPRCSAAPGAAPGAVHHRARGRGRCFPTTGCARA